MLRLSCFPILLFLATIVQGTVYNVSTISQFKTALEAVKKGDTINLASGTYKGKMIGSASGDKENPITIQGPEDAILTNTGYGFQLLGGNYWILRGFTVATSGKGIVIDYGSHNILEHLTVRDINEEGIHFRFQSSDNIVRFSKVHNTGLSRPGYGEGVYIGQDRGKWNSSSEPDKCDRNQILNNTITKNGGECIDIKEGTCCGLISGNIFDGYKLSNVNSDDSWIDVKGDSYIIENNVGTYTIQDGFQVRDHMPTDSGKISGCHNIFRNNKCDLQSKGYCIFFANKGKCQNTVENNNSFTNGGTLTNY